MYYVAQGHRSRGASKRWWLMMAFGDYPTDSADPSARKAFQRWRESNGVPAAPRERKLGTYYSRNRIALIARVCARRWADPEAARAYEREVRFRRREKHRAEATARIRKLGRPDAESVTYRTVLRDDPCSYCGGRAEQIDHIVPAASDGENHWTNLTATCWPCNRAKWDKSLLVALSGTGR